MKKFLVCITALILSVTVNAKPLSYLIGRDPTWFPLDLREKNANVNLFINALFEKINHQEEGFLTIIDVGPLNLMQGLKEKKYDAILTVISPSSQVNDQLDFSDPILLLGPVLVVPITSQANSLSDLCGKLIGIWAFDSAVPIIQKYPSILMKQYENMAQALDDLSQGTLDAVVMDVLDANSLVFNLYPKKLRVATSVLNDEGIRLVTLKEENSQIFPAFNDQLNQFLKSCSYEQLFLCPEVK